MAIKTTVGVEFDVTKPLSTWAEKNRLQSLLLPLALDKQRAQETVDALKAAKEKLDVAREPSAFAAVNRELGKAEADLYSLDDARTQSVAAEVLPRLRLTNGHGGAAFELRTAADVQALLEAAAILLRDSSLDEGARKNAGGSPTPS